VVHGTVADVTGGFIVGVVIDHSGFAGDLIIGHTSL
jgi:hypothetical protein